MNKLKKVTASSKKFVAKHRVAIAVAATTVVLAKVNRMALKQHDDFLREHGLYDEYYNYLQEQ